MKICLNKNGSKIFYTYPARCFYRNEIISTVMLYNMLRLLSYHVVIYRLNYGVSGCPARFHVRLAYGLR